MRYLWTHAIRHYRGGQEAVRASNQQSGHHVRPWLSRFGSEEYPTGVDVMQKLQNHNNSKGQKITSIPRRSTIAKRSWSVTSRTINIKCACNNKDTRSPTWKNLTEERWKGNILGKRLEDEHIVSSGAARKY